jgi:IclR family acetate operon transcriptional repressor
MTESANSSAAALRAVAIMETVARASRPLALSDIAASCGLPAPTAFRILSLLESAGLIQREPTGKTYGIGHRLARLGLDVMSNNDPRGLRRAILRRVVDDIGETCNLAMLNGDEIVYIDRVETDWSLKAELKPGSRVPLHCTSSGKLFLSQMPKAKRRRMLESLSLKRYTDNTVTDITLLEAQIDDIAKTRVGVNNEELQAGVIGLAVPVIGAGGRMIATVALQAPVARLPMARAMECVPRLLVAARDIAATFVERLNLQRGKRRRRLEGPSHRRTPVSSALSFWIPALPPPRSGIQGMQSRRNDDGAKSPCYQRRLLSRRAPAPRRRIHRHPGLDRRGGDHVGGAVLRVMHIQSTTHGADFGLAARQLGGDQCRIHLVRLLHGDGHLHAHAACGPCRGCGTG